MTMSSGSAASSSGMGTSSSGPPCACIPNPICAEGDPVDCVDRGCIYNASSACTGTGNGCGMLGGVCTAHGCTTGTVCGGTHEACEANLSPDACQTHLCTWTPAACTGDHVDCGKLPADTTCTDHGCALGMGCDGVHPACSTYNAGACAAHGCTFNNNLGCEGTPHACSTLGALACAAEPGCALGPVCTQPAAWSHTCANDAPGAACMAAGCTTTAAGCTGTPHTCAEEPLQSCPDATNGERSCSQQPGCTGMADTCESHLEGTGCAEHGGCTWLSTVSCNAATEDACAQASPSACPQGCVTICSVMD